MIAAFARQVRGLRSGLGLPPDRPEFVVRSRDVPGADVLTTVGSW